MKQLLALPQSAELELLKNMLEGEHIPCMLRNEQLSQALPSTPFDVELWVANDEDFAGAQSLCQAWLHPAATASGTWTCAQCGQRLLRQFDSCWKCGTKREPTVTKNKEGKEE